jgi:hypothetical protein
MITHYLKIWPVFFSEVSCGLKKYEVRLNDRNFKVGDRLRLREWNPTAGRYTGAEVTAAIVHMTPGDVPPLGDLLAFSVCILGIEVIR